MPDSGLREHRFKPHRHLCVVSLSKAHLSLLSTGSTQEDQSRHNWKFFDWDVKNQIKLNQGIYLASWSRIPWQANGKFYNIFNCVGYHLWYVQGLGSKPIDTPVDKKYFNIALVLQDDRFTIFTHPANTCTCPLKAYAIKNIREKYVIWLPQVILLKALVLQDKCFGKNYLSFLDFTGITSRRVECLSPSLW